jgi:hypothetical protein
MVIEPPAAFTDSEPFITLYCDSLIEVEITWFSTPSTSLNVTLPFELIVLKAGSTFAGCSSMSQATNMHESMKANNKNALGCIGG